jgi:hypothetical protein
VLFLCAAVRRGAGPAAVTRVAPCATPTHRCEQHHDQLVGGFKRTARFLLMFPRHVVPSVWNHRHPEPRAGLGRDARATQFLDSFSVVTRSWLRRGPRAIARSAEGPRRERRRCGYAGPNHGRRYQAGQARTDSRLVRRERWLRWCRTRMAIAVACRADVGEGPTRPCRSASSSPTSGPSSGAFKALHRSDAGSVGDVVELEQSQWRW